MQYLCCAAAAAGNPLLTVMICLPEINGRWIVGLSGGADSTALLLLLKERGADILAAHVHHGLRGAEADRDLSFCRALCEREEIPFQALFLEPPPGAGESWAREARYDALKELAEQTGAEGLITAHHRRDQAETVLMHLLRGSGLRGLCGMREDSRINGLRILRPLLDCDPEELREYLLQRRQSWCVDSTNDENAYFRNRIRNEIMPVLEAASPGAERRIAETAGTLQTDEECLSQLAEEAWSRIAGDRYLPLSSLQKLPGSIQRRLVRMGCERWLSQQPDSSQTRSTLQLLEGTPGSRMSLGCGVLYRGYRALHFRPEKTKQNRQELPAVDGAALNGVLMKLLPGGCDHGDGRRTQELPRELLAGCVLRTWQAGDWIRPFGMNGKKSLQDWFVDKRVDQPWRKEVPLLCNGSEVLLAAGLGAGGIPNWKQEGDNVRIVWEGPMAWLDEEA